MANEEHLALLKQGVERWNRWRRDNPESIPDLTGADLNRIDLERANLTQAILCEVNLTQTILCGAFLRKADLREANLCEVYLYGAHLEEANLRGADLREAKAQGANLCGANLQGADLQGADLRNSVLYEANLNRTDLSNTDLKEANLNRAYLCETNLGRHDLDEVDLSGRNLSRINLSGSSMRRANLEKTDLRGADLKGVDLRETNLREADLRGANLSGSNLRRVNLRAANLCAANLCAANLIQANLRLAVMRVVNLSEANLSGSNLRRANLRAANLCAAKLCAAQVLGSSFEQSVFTGACIEDWNINSTTSFDGAICDYVYLKSSQQERRPHSGTFKEGEFVALFQQALDTLDLIFKDGIDWQAFFQSFQDLRRQYDNQALSIQAIEKKRGGAFIVRLEVAEDADKKAIESSAKQLYETKLTLLEQRYRSELQAKDSAIVAYREQSANLMKITEMLAMRPPMPEGNKYDLRGAQFGGGYVAGNVAGNQYGGIINNYGPNAEDITRLLTALRDQAKTFPTDQKDEANDVLDDLERDLADEQPDQSRIGRRLKKLVALGAAIGTIASGAAAVSGDVSTFTGNVIELTQQLGIPVKQVQLPPSETP